MTEKIPKERYKSYRASPIVIKFPIDIDDKEYDALRTYLYELFPVSMIERYAPKVVIAIVPEGMVPEAKYIEQSFVGADITVDVDNYDIYIEKRK